MSTIGESATSETAKTPRFFRPDRKLSGSRGRALTPARMSLELVVGLVLASFVVGFGWFL